MIEILIEYVRLVVLLALAYWMMKVAYDTLWDDEDYDNE